MRFWHIVLVGTLVLASCGSDKRDSYDPGAQGAGDGGVDPGKDPFGMTDASTSEGGTLPIVGRLQGTVYAPEGTVPISQAMVYLTATMPDAIPAGVYCDTCVHLTAYEPYAYTKSDGTFDLAAYATGKQYLVTQKGQFRRIRQVDVVKGDQPIAGDLTRLPGKTDTPNGDTIPKIAMVVGGYDKIDYSMKKLGIEEFYRYGDAPPGFPGGDGPGIKTAKAGNDLMGSTTELAGYHIVLLPCAAMGYSDTESGGFLCGQPSSQQKTSFASYVDSGGKLYVTDFAYEAVRQTWPGFITFYDDTMTPLTSPSQGIGTACRGGAEDTPGTAQDPGLKDWMNAIGDSSITLEQSWSRIQKVTAQPGYDSAGKPVTITPKVWMTSDIGTGTELPATVSFEQKCGRVLFSTYHAEGDDTSTLLAQEKALLYVLLEVGVCVGELPPPPPPR
jgi:hypothetical protein